MKHRPVFVLLFLVALSLTAMGQESLSRESNTPSEQLRETTGEPAHIYVIGEVANPGKFVMSQPLTLMDAISLAAGFKNGAATHAYLHRRVKEGESLLGLDKEKLLENPQIASPGTEVIDIDVMLLYSGGDLKQNIQMEAGDVLVIPRNNSYYYFIVGAVSKPGAHKIPSG